MRLPLKLKPEEKLQIQVHEWFCLSFPRHKEEFHHFAGERRCSRIYGHILHLMGVKAGVADIFIDVPMKSYRGLWVELKVGKNKPTEAQKHFLARKAIIGYVTGCVVGFDAAKEFIENYMH